MLVKKSFHGVINILYKYRYDVKVCLWDEFAKCTNVAMNDAAFYPVHLFIIVMSSCIMVKDLYSGVITLSDTSSTKFYFNYDLPRVSELRDM